LLPHLPCVHSEAKGEMLYVIPAAAPETQKSSYLIR
jgi:hypothetical protein